MLYLYANSDVLETFDESSLEIAITKSISESRELSTRKGDYTKTITIPATASNKKILGFQENPYTLRQLNSSFISAKITDGSSTLIEGHLKFLSATDDEYEVTVVGNNADWSTRLKQIKLSDLDLSENDHIYDVTPLTLRMSGSTGAICYPFIDYGLTKLATSSLGNRLSVEDFKPAIKIAYLIEKMFNEIGYTVNSAFLTAMKSNPNELVMPFCNEYLKTSDSFLNTNKFSVTNSVAQSIVFSINTGPLNWVNLDTITLNSGISVINNEIYVPTISKQKITLTLNLTALTASFTTLTLFKNGVPQENKIVASFSGTTDVVFEFNAIDLTTGGFGDRLKFQISRESTDYTINSVVVTNKIINEVIKGMNIETSLQMPDITCLELLSDIKTMFNLYFDTDNNMRVVSFDPRDVFFKSLSYAQDFTNNEDKDYLTKVEYLNANAPKELRYEYADDSNDEFVTALNKANNIKFGYSSFEFDNVFADNEETLKLDIIAPTYCELEPTDEYINRFGFAPKCAKMWNGEGGVVPDFSTKFNPRILRLLTPISADWDFEGNAMTAYLPALSYDTNFNLMFGDLDKIGLMEKYHNSENHLLNYGKIVTKRVYLNNVDFANIDLSAPVKFGNEYFYINKIKDFKPYELCTIELVTIPSVSVVSENKPITTQQILFNKVGTIGINKAKFKTYLGYDDRGDFIISKDGTNVLRIDKQFNTISVNGDRVPLKTVISGVQVDLYTVINGVQQKLYTNG